MNPIPTPTAVPPWRQNAKAGTSLAQLAAAAAPPPPPPAAPAAPSVAPPAEKKLTNIIRPNARDRWMAATLAYYTPQIIENTFRGAMSGNLVAQWQLMDLMEQTWPRLNKNLNEIKNGAKSMNRIVQPFAEKDEKPTPEAIRRAKIVDKLLRTMRPDIKKLERDLDDTIYDVLDALGKGIEISEILWEQRPVKILGGVSTLWCPRATKWTHQRYYGFPHSTDYEEALMLNAREIGYNNPEFSKQAGTALWLPIPDDQFIVSIMQQKSGHPINSSLLRILGFIWAASNFTWEWFVNFAQIFGAPIRWATYDSGTATADTIQNILDMLAQMGSFGFAAFPAGTQLELKEAIKSAADNPQKALLDVADLICDLMILGQTLTSEVRNTGGNRALGQVHQDMRTERIQSAANAAAKTISEQMVRAICRLNFNDDSECPALTIVTRANKDLVQQAERYQILMQIPGVQISKQQFYEDNELVVPDENDDTLEGQAPASPLDVARPERNPAQARAAATDKVVDRMLNNLTPVEERWLGGVKPFFRALVAKAMDQNVSDADFIRTLERAKKEMPGLFDQLDKAALATALEKSMGAAAANGAIRGYMRRRVPA